MDSLQTSYSNVENYQITKNISSYVAKERNLQIDQLSILDISKTIAYLDMLYQLYPFNTYFVNHRFYFSALPIKKEFITFYQTYMEAINHVATEVPLVAHYPLEILSSLFFHWKDL